MLNVNIGKGITLAIDETKFGVFDPNTALSHILSIGLRNILMDSHASVTKIENPDDFKEKSEAVALAKLDALYANEVRTNAGTKTRETDPVAKQAKTLANAWMAARLGKSWAKGEVSNKDTYAELTVAFEPLSVEETAVDHLTRIRDIVANSPKIVADATEMVEKAKGTKAVDLGSLGL
jgi:hypothetical protein